MDNQQRLVERIKELLKDTEINNLAEQIAEETVKPSSGTFNQGDEALERLWTTSHRVVTRALTAIVWERMG